MRFGWLFSGVAGLFSGDPDVGLPSGEAQVPSPVPDEGVAQPFDTEPGDPGACGLQLNVLCIPPPGALSCNSTPPPVEQCEGRPFELTFLYNGGGCEQSLNVQEAAGKFYCTDMFVGGPPYQKGEKAFIVVTDLDGETTFYEDWAEVGSLLTLSNGGNNFPADQLITIYGSDDTTNPGNILQAMQYHCSCSQNLFLNDRFGAVQLVSFINEDQGVVSLFQNQSFSLDIIYTGVSASMTSLAIITNIEPFFFNITDLVTGKRCEEGDKYQIPASIPVDLTQVRVHNLIFTLVVVTDLGQVCSANAFTSFSAGYPLPPIFPTFSPTSAPSGTPAPWATPPPTSAPVPDPILLPTPPPNPEPCVFEMNIQCIPPSGALSCNDRPAQVVQCEGRPFEMGFVYRGGDCEHSHNAQPIGEKFTCVDQHGGPPTQRGEKSFVVITALKDDTLYHYDWVEVGGTFTLQDGGNNFVADQLITIYRSNNTDDPNNVLQAMQYHSSCSPNLLFLNDQFGSVQLVNWVNEVQGRITSFLNQTFDLDITVPIDIVGGPATVQSLTVASNVDPFFFNYTDRVSGVVMDAGDTLEISISIPIHLTTKKTYNLLFTLGAVTMDGRECHGTSLTSFTAGYPLPPIFPTFSPTHSPSIISVGANPEPPTPERTPSPALAATPLRTCELDAAIECYTASGRSCQTVYAPTESVCNDMHGVVSSLEFLITGKSCGNTADCEEKDLGPISSPGVFVTVIDMEEITRFEGVVGLGDTFRVSGPFVTRLGITLSSTINGRKGEALQILNRVAVGCSGWIGDDLTLLTNYGALQLVGFASPSQGIQSVVETFLLTMAVTNGGNNVAAVFEAFGTSAFEPAPINLIPQGPLELHPLAELRAETTAMLNLAESVGSEFHFDLSVVGFDMINALGPCSSSSRYVLRVLDMPPLTNAPTMILSDAPTEYPFWTPAPSAPPSSTPTGAPTEDPFWEPCTIDMKVAVLPNQAGSRSQSFLVVATSAPTDMTSFENGMMMAESLFVASNVEPFSLEFDDVHGMLMGHGEILETSVPIPVDSAQQHKYELLFVLSATTLNGQTCTGHALASFTTGAYPSPVHAPTQSPNHYPIQYPTSLEPSCGLEGSIECVTSSGMDCQFLKPPKESLCDSAHGSIESVSFLMTGRGLVALKEPVYEQEEESDHERDDYPDYEQDKYQDYPYDSPDHEIEPPANGSASSSGNNVYHTQYADEVTYDYGDKDDGDEYYGEVDPHEIHSEFYVVAKVYEDIVYEGIVPVGGTFNVGNGIERDCLTISISSVIWGGSPGRELQVLDPVHFTCKGREGKDLALLQDIGPLRVVSFSNAEQGTQSVFEEIEVTYFIRNNGLVPATPLAAIKLNKFEGRYDLLHEDCGTLYPGSQLSFKSPSFKINLLEMAGGQFDFHLDLVGETEDGEECVDYQKLAVRIVSPFTENPTTQPPSGLPTCYHVLSPSHYDGGEPYYGEVPSHAPLSPSVDVRSILSRIALLGGAEWGDTSSYQYKAMNWLENDSFSQGLSDERIQQRYALACIYFATYAVRTIYTVVEPRGWIDSTGWVTGVDECTWFGLTCNANFEVEKIVLASNRITGSFPPETAILASSLTRLDLFRNSVYNTGDEGNGWLGQLTNLRELFHGQTNFEYNGIPPQIGQLTNLVEYDCSFTLYYGPLQGSTFAPLQNLEYLVLSGNAYNSSIPWEIGELPNLQFLYIQNSFVAGDLSFMYPMQSMIELWTSQNPGLGGPLYTHIGELQTLQSWDISNCAHTGEIPTDLGLMSNMVRLWLHGNNFRGTLPSELGNMFKLQTLTVGDNFLSGTMPDFVCLNRVPMGLLQTLEADCEGPYPRLECDCCNNCGSDAFAADEQLPMKRSDESLLHHRRNKYYNP